MDNLKRGSKGKDVEELQDFLRRRGYYIKVDGHYGPATALVVYWYQKGQGLTADKRFGPRSRASMGSSVQCKYQEFALDRQTTVIRMHKDITRAEIIDPTRQTLKQMFRSLVRKPTVIFNGTLYGVSNMADLGHMKVGGVQVGYNYYDAQGLQIAANGHISIGRDSDRFHEFMGFSPAIYINGVINTEYKDLDRGFTNNKHPRTMIQVTDKYVNGFIVRGRNWVRRWYGVNMKGLQEYALAMAKYDNCKDFSAGNLDGGGSTGAYTKRGVIYGWASRGLANGLALYVDGY